MRYEVWYADQNGAKLELLDTFIRLEYVIVDGDVGTVIIDMPDDDNRVYSKPIRDNQIQVFRGADNATIQLETIGLTRKFSHSTTNDGARTVTISSPDLNEITTRRINAYQENSSQGTRSAAIDNIMKQLARDNLAGAAIISPDRDLSSFLSIDDNDSAGDSTTIKMAWKEVRKVLQELQNTSRSLGNEIFWRIVPFSIPSGKFKFITKTGQPGADRTASGNNQIVFSTEFGNLTDIQYVDDFSSEATYVYAGGRNVGQSKLIGTASDDDRAEKSKLNRREVFVNGSGAQVTAELEQIAGQALNSMRPRRTIKATILSTPTTPYGGSGWKFGDKVIVADSGVQFDAIIRSVHVVVSGDGKEDISASVEGDIFI